MSNEKPNAGSVCVDSDEPIDEREERYLRLQRTLHELGQALMTVTRTMCREREAPEQKRDAELIEYLQGNIVSGIQAHVILTAAIDYLLSRVPSEGGRCPICATAVEPEGKSARHDRLKQDCDTHMGHLRHLRAALDEGAPPVTAAMVIAARQRLEQLCMEATHE